MDFVYTEILGFIVDVRLIFRPLFSYGPPTENVAPPECNAALVVTTGLESWVYFIYIFDNLEHVLFSWQRRHFGSTLSVADVAWNCVGHSLCLAHFQSRARISRQINENLCCVENIEQVPKTALFLMVLHCRRLLHALIIFGIQIH